MRANVTDVPSRQSAERWDAEAFIRDTRQRECHRPTLHSRSDGLAPGQFTVFHNKMLFAGLDAMRPGRTMGDQRYRGAGTTEVGGIGSAGINGVNSAELFGLGSYSFFTVFDNEVLFHDRAMTCRCG